jgi:diguanylate cyclase (GGDEF)-like protein
VSSLGRSGRFGLRLSGGPLGAPALAQGARTTPVTAAGVQAQLPVAAAIYIGCVATAAVVAGARFLVHLRPTGKDWVAFLVLAGGAAVSQLAVVRTPRTRTYQTTIVFVVAAALLVPPGLVALVAVLQHVPDWIKERYRWPVPIFNIANHTLAALAATGVAVAIGRAPSHHLRFLVCGVAAALTFVVVSRILVGGMTRISHGAPLHASGIFSLESLGTDLAFAVLAVAVAGVWHMNPWLVVAVVAPLVLMHRSLVVPVLEQEVRLDSKTGLFNHRHFSEALADEVARATRFDRPLSLLMADLDLLREVNNTHGHLAGDAVLVGIAGIFRNELRPYDLAARFGGEEYAVLLPETDGAAALQIAERVRERVDEARFGEYGEVRATVSIGVATFPADAPTETSLVASADAALYRAKLDGRNRVRRAEAAVG